CAGISENGFLNTANIRDFRGCTYVDGNLRILKQSFVRSFPVTGAITVDVLQTLKDVKEIDGFVTIQGMPPELRHLTFLAGLEVIHGRNLSSGASLSIQNTEIEFLGLTSLQRINNGNVELANNKYLCYLENLDMSLIFANTSQRLLKKANQNESECEKSGLQCSYNCVGHGCWGPGTDKCLKCENMIINITDDNICLEGCGNMSLVYLDENKCPQPCHEQCKSGCTGPVVDNCLQCKYVKVPFYSRFLCASKCPPDLYQDENNVCRNCDPACYHGCTGPSSELKRGGCNSCALAISRTHETDSLSCLPRGQKKCPKGYYKRQNKDDVLFKEICKPCDGQCTVCFGPGNSNCSECKTLRFLNSTCVSECPSNSFLQDDECIPCHDQCTGGCHGASYIDCVKCLNFKIFHNEEMKSFACVKSCPRHLPMRRKDPDKTSTAVCVSENVSENGSTNATNTSGTTFTAAGTAAAILFSCIVITLCVVLWWRRKEQRAKLSSLEQMNKDDSPFPIEEPLSLTDVKPDKSNLRIIKESELRRGGEIGRGAFGQVYKGFWVPEGEDVKIPVAIKVIREGNSSSLHQELLEEARIMVSVVHICCIRLLAVCMASEKMMMISQLMPLGCLLGYIKKHKDMIGSKSLLNWCAQIARGMVYLEERGIVHRDLAARNILVQSAAQVKITDFGLAKLLDFKEDEFQSAEEKVPVRWLAPESLQSRIYSHKSDVWSYGVTLWEMFTYGKRPYEKSQNRDVLSLIEKGDRLPQPDICTIDVYMIMIKCWMYNAENRPSFKELAEDFSKMARDPGRYLVIQGDEMMKTPTQLDSINDLDLEMDACADGPEKLITADNYIKIESRVQLHEKCNETTSAPAEVDIHLDADGYLKTIPEPHIYLDLEGNDGKYTEMKERHFTMDGRNGDKRRLLKSEYEPAGSLKSEYENDPSSLKCEYVNEAGFRGSEYEPAGCPRSERAHADTAVLEDIQRQHKSASTSHSNMV
ncbi:epidermal growth factor receptor-like, partial [Mercenaria mercenaria]|uniref:epidermal growth factor receptor-like n=1 Tax=Mercenaria mercenaria TaxID=6596 RepID=UPI00234F58A2